MNEVLTLHMGWPEWLQLFLHYVVLSLLAVGGAITTAPDMHRYLVDEQHWLTDTQFNTAIAIAQASPGPNVLFVALMGLQIGLNNGGLMIGLMGALLTMLGILLPSTTLTYSAARWCHDNRQLRAVRAFKQGMAPLVPALLIATAWLLVSAYSNPVTDWPLWVTSAITTVIAWKTRTHLLLLLGLGGLLGWFGVI